MTAIHERKRNDRAGRSTWRPEVESLESRIVLNADPAPVLMVISNQDFWYDDYADTRQALEESGVEVRVAAATADIATPHWNSGQGGDGGFVTPDLTLADVNADDYSAIAFMGGWGMAQYQYGFEGTYHNSTYDGDVATKELVNTLVNEFVEQDKYVAAVCYGVSVLAYARVDGASLLEGRTVTGWNGAAPYQQDGWQSSRDQIESNGANMLPSGSIGDASTATDDVFVDGKIITAENWNSAYQFGQTLAHHVQMDAQAETIDVGAEPETDGESSDQPSPVLMVIANQDFYYREYGDTRASLEAQGLDVVVAATTTDVSTPHVNSGQGGDSGHVTPDIALANVDASGYSAIVFVGGWGSSQYQYAYEGTYGNAAYNGADDVKQIVNDLINDFVEQDKYIAAICHGVSVLAYARVDGDSPIENKTVASWAGNSPWESEGEGDGTTRWHIESNGAVMVASGSVGDANTVEDDVIVDGNIITAENYDSAAYFGEVVAEELMAAQA